MDIWGLLGIVLLGALFSAGVLAVALVAGVLRGIWLTFKWRVLGIKPNILCETLIRKVSESAAESGTAYWTDVVSLEFSDRQKQRIKDHLTHLCGQAVREYVYEFAGWFCSSDPVPEDRPTRSDDVMMEKSRYLLSEAAS